MPQNPLFQHSQADVDVDVEMDATHPADIGLDDLELDPPENWHQAVAFAFATNAVQDATLRRNCCPMCCKGALLVIVQAIVAMAVALGTDMNPCSSADQCADGEYCRQRSDMCTYCGHASLGMKHGPAGTNLTYNKPMDPGFAGFIVADVVSKCSQARDGEGSAFLADWVDWCNGCASWPDNEGVFDGFEYNTHMTDDTYTIHIVPPWTADRLESVVAAKLVDIAGADALTLKTLHKANVDMMGFVEWVTLTFCAVNIGYVVVGELKDIRLVNIYMTNKSAEAAKGTCFPFRSVGFRWFRIVGWFCRWVVVPLLLMSVPRLVLVQGSDAISVRFAILIRSRHGL
jgi:hypothetical protein